MDRCGYAQLLVIAAHSTHWWFPFSEVSFSIMVACPFEGARYEGFYLIHAFNSVPFFAFYERTFFSTPYHFGESRVTTGPTPQIRLDVGGRQVLLSQMNLGSQPHGRARHQWLDAGWSAPVFLPVPHSAPSSPKKWFYAQIQGQTEEYPFLRSRDTFMLPTSPREPAITLLKESHFMPQFWSVREKARHAKSRTYPIHELPTFCQPMLFHSDRLTRDMPGWDRSPAKSPWHPDGLGGRTGPLNILLSGSYPFAPDPRDLAR